MGKKGAEAIKVVVRIRPLNSREIQDGHQIITKAHEEQGQIEIKSNSQSSSSESTRNFTFDSVFSDKATQRQIYDVVAAPVVKSVLEGYNGTIFAYGQTGAGKTHTMEGKTDDPNLRGIIPNAFQHIFDHVALVSSNDKYLVRASYFEIYNEEIRDLLSSNPKHSNLELKESTDTGVYVKDLISKVVKSFEEISQIMQAGNKNRSVGATKMNQTSSRSHSVFTIVVECCSKDDRGEDHIRMGKLNLVDLAGSERQGKTGATGERLKEATKINLSLSALGNVISALVNESSQYVPYRDSKLTRILQDSLGGNTKTVMCANAGPAEYNYDETLSTLRYANRAKNIKNKPKINEDPSDAMLREYQDEIKKLKAQLERMNTTSGENNSFSDGEYQGGLQTEKMKEIKEQADKEKAEIVERSKVEMEKMKTEQHQTAKERLELEAQLEKESKARIEMEEQRSLLQQKLEGMEAQLMIGGEMVSKAAKQEASFRKADQELAAKREAEISMIRKMAEKEEENFQLNEKYSSLNEEVQSKTKKLRRLYSKYQQAKAEIIDLQHEFQTERNDLLESVRELKKQVQLKELVIDNFIPPKYAKLFDDQNNGGCAEWDDEDEEWIIPKLELSGNVVVKNQIPTSIAGLPRPESEYTRYQKKIDPKNPRWRYNNVSQFDLDMPDRATSSYGDGSEELSDHIEGIINMSIDHDSRGRRLSQSYRGEREETLGKPYLKSTSRKKGKKLRTRN